MNVKWRSAALAALLMVSGAVAASPAGATQVTGTDPTGDVPRCSGDITSWGVDWEGASLTFTMATKCVPGINSRAWNVGDSAAWWFIDAGTDGVADYVVELANDGTSVYAELLTVGGGLVCTGTPAEAGGTGSEQPGFAGRLTATFASSCLSGPFGAAAALQYDENPFGACTCAVDSAPDGGAAFVGPVEKGRQGYWMVGRDGSVNAFGDAAKYTPNSAIGDTVDLEPSPTGRGYFTVTKQGIVMGHGDSVRAPSPLVPLDGGPGEEVTAISVTRSGHGYWVFTTLGRVVPFGDAPFLGDMSGTKLNGPVLDSIVTPSGNGYYMVASDGGIFTFGDAVFYGSMGATKLNKPVQSLVPDADGIGYWLVASDGGIFAFEAPFYGSMGDTALAKPVTGMVGFGNGYLMVGEDGGIFTFGDAPFLGSLGDNPPAVPIVSVAVLNT
jgi:hypothetical protein